MKFRGKTITIATAADEGFKDFLAEWIDCIRTHKIHDYAEIVVFDCGLLPATREAIETYGISVRDAPEHKIHVEGLPPHFAALTLRPSLPQLLPGSDFIVWLDADVWIQDAGAIRDFVIVAQTSEIACCVELDSSYKVFSQSDVHNKIPFASETDNRSIYEYWTLFFSRFYPDDLSRRLAAYPHINAGVFCAHRDSAVWAVWSDMLDKCLTILANRKIATDFLGNRLDLLVDQTALNAAVRIENIEIGYLPTAYNWVCHRALPMFDENKALLTEPSWPYNAIKIIHLTTGEIKAMENFQITTVTNGVIGSSRDLSLRWSGRALL